MPQAVEAQRARERARGQELHAAARAGRGHGVTLLHRVAAALALADVVVAFHQAARPRARCCTLCSPCHLPCERKLPMIQRSTAKVFEQAWEQRLFESSGAFSPHCVG